MSSSVAVNSSSRPAALEPRQQAQQPQIARALQQAVDPARFPRQIDRARVEQLDVLAPVLGQSGVE